MDETKAYVPGFDYDVFISYAHVDDETATRGEKGWVERFHDHLAVKLGQRFGRADRVRIWRDPDLTGNELFDDVIRRRIERSAVFLSLTSIGHLESEYCRQEVRWFHEHVLTRGPGPRVGERLRFFNVLLYNVPADRWPAEFGRTSGFPFYRARDKEDVGRPLDPDDPELQGRLWKLVDAIYRTLTEFEPARPEEPPEKADGGCDVYLAAVADSLRTTRRRLAEELVRRGITVREKPPPPYKAERHRADARTAIERAQLSLHLLDGLRGAEVDGDEENTYPWEQVELGRQHAASQMIWVPRALDPETIDDEAQAELLHRLEHGERGERPYDFVRGMAADLADDVSEKLRQLAEAARAPRAAPPAVLLDVQRQDELCVLDLGRALLERQVVPYINPQENDPRRNDEILHTRLRQVGAMIVVYGRVHEEWVSGRLEQAANIVFSEKVPLRAFCVYLAPPRESKVDLRERFPLLNLHVLDNRDGFDPSALAPLFETLPAGDAR